MMMHFPVIFHLSDGTRVLVEQLQERCYDFHLTRLNSEKHNFIWDETTQQIKGYDNRFVKQDTEAIDIFCELKKKG
jgi:hypothetical protein